MFISPSGVEAISDLRVGPAPRATGGCAPVQLLACLPSEECGCPEEIWLVDGIQALIHFEADGSSECFLYAGDWEAERQFQSRNIQDLRAQLFRWIADIWSQPAPNQETE